MELTREEIITILAPKGHLTCQHRTMKNTGNVRECIYVDGSLAGKEQYGGVYKLCNEFSDLAVA